MPTATHSLNGNGKIQHQSIELPTEEVQDLLGEVPGWTIRWGITLVFTIVSLLLFASWLVKYPDILNSRVVLTSKTPPVGMVARTEGRIQFFIKNNQHASKGTYLAVIESTADIKDIWYLNSQLQKIKGYLKDRNPQWIINIAPQPDLNLGELQNAYLSLLTSVQDYKRTTRTSLFEKQSGAVRQRIQQYEQLNLQLEKQQQLAIEEVQLAQKRLSVDSKLLAEKVIADLDFDKTKSAFLQSKQSFESTQTEIINNQISIGQLQAQVIEYQSRAVEEEDRLRNNVATLLNQLESQLQSWEQKYVFKCPIEGEVVFKKHWSSNQFINNGEEILTIVPVSKDLFAQVQLPVTGSGKVEIGQRVNIRFDNYPSSEYGLINGVVQSISLIPQDNLYTVQIILPEGLTTSYRHKLPFRPQMQGTAEIITRDLRLIERIIYQFRALLDTGRT